MRNFYIIAFYDWLMLRANKLLVACFALLTLFCAFALWTGQQRVIFREKTLTQVQAQEQKSFAEKKQLVAEVERSGQAFTGNSHRDPTTPNGAANSAANRYFTLKPAPLGVLAVGQSDLRAYYYKFALYKKQALYHGEEIENASILYNGHFDFAFVLVFLLPLLIIALTFNVVSGEKERGTLPLIQASTSALRSIALQKITFRLLLFGGFASLVVLLGLAVTGSLQNAAPGHVLGLLGLLWAYTAFWFGLSFMVNSLGKNSGFNAGVLTGTWLALLVLVPALVSVLANAYYPMPSRVELIAETREASDAAREKGAQVLAQYLEDHPELAAQGNKPINTQNFAVNSLMVNLEMEKAMRPLEEKFEIQKAGQMAFLERCRFFSPAIFVQQLLENLAGSSEAHYQDFEAQVQVAQAEYRSFFTEKILKGEKMRAIDYEHVPQPRYKPSAPLTQYTRHAWYDLCYLLLATGLFVVLGYRQLQPQRLSSSPWMEA